MLPHVKTHSKWVLDSTTGPLKESVRLLVVRPGVSVRRLLAFRREMGMARREMGTYLLPHVKTHSKWVSLPQLKTHSKTEGKIDDSLPCGSCFVLDYPPPARRIGQRWRATRAPAQVSIRMGRARRSALCFAAHPVLGKAINSWLS